MKTKHTPSPWLMNVTKKYIDNKGLAITDSKGRLVCEVMHDLTQLDIVEYEANAKLIVAAPDLFEALNDLLSITKDSEGVCGYHKNGNVAEWNEFSEVSKAIEAIKKATE